MGTQSPGSAGQRAGEHEWRPSLGVSMASKGLALLEFPSHGYVQSSHSAPRRQMRRWLGTTARHGSYTFLLAFSFPTLWVTMRHGCGSTALVTGTRRVSTAGALQSCVFYTGSCARGVVGLRRTRHLVDACTCYSCRCGLVFQLVVQRYWLVVSGSKVSLQVVILRGRTFGTRSGFRTRG